MKTMTLHTNDKKLARQLKNRLSAEKSRKQKNDTIDSLQQQLQLYNEMISKLRVENWLIQRNISIDSNAVQCGYASSMWLNSDSFLKEPAMGGELNVTTNDDTDITSDTATTISTSSIEDKCHDFLGKRTYQDYELS